MVTADITYAAYTPSGCTTIKAVQTVYLLGAAQHLVCLHVALLSTTVNTDESPA